MTPSRERIVEMLAAEWDQVFDDPIEAAHETLTVIERAGFKIVSGEPVAYIGSGKDRERVPFDALIWPQDLTDSPELRDKFYLTPLYREQEPQT